MELNNNQMVALKEEVKHEVLGLGELVAADSQVVTGAGEVRIKEEMLEAPSDESWDEAHSVVGDEEGDPFDPSTNLLLEVEDDGRVVVGGDVGGGEREEILVSLLSSLLMLFQLYFSSGYRQPLWAWWGVPRHLPY